jgi:hypothetical protein
MREDCIHSSGRIFADLRPALRAAGTSTLLARKEASLGVLSQFDGVSCRIRAGARDHRDPAASDGNRDFNERLVFYGSQCGRFAGRSADDERGGALA